MRKSIGQTLIRASTHVLIDSVCIAITYTCQLLKICMGDFKRDDIFLILSCNWFALTIMLTININYIYLSVFITQFPLSNENKNKEHIFIFI